MMHFRMAKAYLVLMASVLLVSCASHSGDSAPSGEFDHTSVPNAVPRDEPRSRYGNPSNYVVFGKTYHVMSDAEAEGFTQEGLASWYGTKFHGRRTSSGEPYDMYKMTAAHKELPLPSYVRVENIDNGRSVIVRVNDRGPFHDGRIIDLSYAAALKLGVVSTGTAPVKIEVLAPGAPSGERNRASSAAGNSFPEAAVTSEEIKNTTSPVQAVPPEDDWYVQLAAFSSEDNAMAFKIRLETSGLRPVQIAPDTAAGIFRVRLGPYPGKSAANETAMQLAALGISEFKVYQD